MAGTLLLARRMGVMLSLTFLVMLGFGFQTPVLPLYARTFGVTSAELGLVASAFALGRFFFEVPGGRLTDKYGIRPVAGTGLIAVGLSTVGVALAPEYWILLVFRVLSGIGSAIYVTSLYNYVAVAVPPDQLGRAFALFQSTVTAGTAIGPLAGGLLGAALGLTTPMFLYGATAVTAGALFLVFLREPAPPAGVHHAVRSVVSASLRSPAYVAACVIIGIAFWTRFGVQSTLLGTYVAEGFDLSPARVEGAFGLVLTVAAVAGVPGAAWLGGIADRYGRRAVLVPTLLVSAGLAALTGVVGSFWLFVVVMAAFGFVSSGATTLPSSMVADITPREAAGVGIGIFRMAADFGLLAGPVLSGAVEDAVGFGWAFGIGGACLGAAALVAYLAPETLGAARIAPRVRAPATEAVTPSPAP